jgi:hypothetical protein
MYHQEWYAVCCGCRNSTQKDMCLQEIGVHAQKMMVKIIGVTI